MASFLEVDNRFLKANRTAPGGPLPEFPSYLYFSNSGKMNCISGAIFFANGMRCLQAFAAREGLTLLAASAVMRGAKHEDRAKKSLS